MQMQTSSYSVNLWHEAAQENNCPSEIFGSQKIVEKSSTSPKMQNFRLKNPFWKTKGVYREM